MDLLVEWISCKFDPFPLGLVFILFSLVPIMHNICSSTCEFNSEMYFLTWFSIYFKHF